ncbi:cytochrome c oxidase assembly protein subunit 11 [Natronocella acetinitrilica]|uniref:Cytochrome c oxidase assembly protein CtaG n=1 Tax=Natronocella acetinitrilica TaxID=414046 RepID=A0AAE3G3M6_9GAMM|nr:cytochrome c oxidase assembly protein [Natronocella acetinitrilica]MCP1675210.1 cytochrome c oxidase assembly protein subunit 11 [Natronocella acetinitrilica]
MSESRANHTRVVSRMLLLVVGMFAFGFAMVPIYEKFCEVTGFNGFVSTQAAEGPAGAGNVDRTVTVEFVSSVNQRHPWTFRAEESRMEVQPGELYTAYFKVENARGGAGVTQIVPSVAPGTAGRHFKKTECFCFTEQRFDEGETRRMPVTFFIDPALPDRTTTVTLSYTLFDISAGDEPEFDENDASLHVGAR